MQSSVRSCRRIGSNRVGVDTASGRQYRPDPVWTRAVSRFDDNTIRPHHKAWIGLTRPVGLVEDTALIAAPNEFARDYLENRLRPMIASVLSDELGREIHVAVTVQPQDEPADVNDFYDSVSGEPEDRFVPGPHVRRMDSSASIGRAERRGPGA